MFYAPKIYIIKNNILHNISAIRQYIGTSKKLCLTIKSDAYGHGIANIVHIVKDQHIEYFGISSVEEASAIQQVIQGWQYTPKILLYTQQIKQDIQLAINHNCELMVGDIEYLKDILYYSSLFQKKVSIHIQLDTGMGRLGLLEKDIQAFCLLLQSSNDIRVVGLSTHFSQSEDDNVTQQQLERYAYFKKIMYKHLPLHAPLIEHTANSGALVWQSQSYFDMLRPGILLYGSYASERDIKHQLHIKPAMKLVSYISRVARYPANHGISYGSLYKTTKDTNIAVINIGYGKGLLKALGNRAKVCINNTLYPIVGNITMDMCMVDVGDDLVKAGDEVVFWGDDTVRIEEQARVSGSIPYELICTISSSIERIVV